jgi:hypothetical protein
VATVYVETSIVGYLTARSREAVIVTPEEFSGYV